ncbi:hypothetical protein D3C75_855770 [compost metagenome]
MRLLKDAERSVGFIDGIGYLVQREGILCTQQHPQLFEVQIVFAELGEVDPSVPDENLRLPLQRLAQLADPLRNLFKYNGKHCPDSQCKQQQQHGFVRLVYRVPYQIAKNHGRDEVEGG